ncbi:hypothetical protein B1H10_05030 [candidate division KSB1 bacterium 4484_188]|nr:MAG: hypothetical protein B1H10_05030 [candidate division KSB1 bacterium 4484_188]
MHSAITITDESFAELRDYVYHHSGIYLTENKKRLLEKRMSSRLSTLGFGDFSAYLKHLKQLSGQGKELNSLIDIVTVNETSFFRNEFQLKALENVVFPEIFEKKTSNNDQLFRILCVGCSSGEEPYTLAMILNHRFSEKLKEVKVEIIGTDISQQVVKRAYEGIYKEFSLKNVEREYLQKYFTRRGDNFVLNQDIRRVVHFRQVSTIDESQMKSLGMFDLILCRNVLIYFKQESKTKAVNTLYQILNPGGYLFVGHSESLYGIEHEFRFVHFVKAIGYQKPDLPERKSHREGD